MYDEAIESKANGNIQKDANHCEPPENIVELE
jgi:hypothetical protein